MICRKRVRRKIEVRQRALEHDGLLPEAAAFDLQQTANREKLVLPITVDEPPLATVAARGGAWRQEDRPRAALRFRLRFLDARQPLVNALVEAGAEELLSADKLERFEPGNPGEQVEVGHEEAVRIGDPIRDGHDQMPQRVG